MKRSNMTMFLLILVLAFGLTACGKAKNNKETASGQTSESGTSLSAELGDAKEAADLYQKLMQGGGHPVSQCKALGKAVPDDR